MEYLLATASVHTTAAAADHLESRLGADDEVVVVTVDEPALSTRDAGDAANVARSRLAPATVEHVERSGDPAAAVAEVARERAVDAIVVGSRRGDPGGAGEPPGSTVRALVGDAEVPVIVVPVPDL